MADVSKRVVSVAGAGLAVLLAAVLGGPAGSVGVGAAFAEIKWPFPIDQWGLGRAFRCAPSDCGATIEVYLRAKVGFCNCSAGVADDDEVDRVGDIEILGGKAVVPLAPGRPVRLGNLAGRTRPFRVDSLYRGSRFAVAVALANKCDAVVATLVTDREPTAEQQAAALAFLASEPVRAWAEANTGLQ